MTRRPYTQRSSEQGTSTVSYALLVTLIAITALCFGGSENSLAAGTRHTLVHASNELGGSTTGTTIETSNASADCSEGCSIPASAEEL